MDTVSPELPEFLRVLLSLGLVLVLIAGISFLMKKLGLAAETGRFKGKAAERRLEVIESLPLDTRRRVAIIRCDDQEHLVILGMQGETVVQSNITPPTTRTHQEPVDGTRKDQNRT